MRIGGVNIPVGKRVVIALTYIYGIGPSRAKVTCEACGISSGVRVHELSEDEVSSIRDYIRSNYLIEADLRKEVGVNIKRLIDLNCYRGIRHRRGLPVRGQRTHTNAKTRKGRSRLAVAMRK